MSVTRWAPLLLTAALAGCTVTVEPGAEPSGGVSGGPSASASTGPGCPWAENRGQEYEPETGRIKLVRTCLDRKDTHGAGGYVYRAAATTERADQFTDGVQAAVLCVDRGGESYPDSGGHTSTVWFKVDGTFAAGDGKGYVPHAATGYAAIVAEDTC